MEQELASALELREKGELKKSNKILVSLVEKYPDDAFIHYQCAWSFDRLGEESRAVPYYVKAIDLGLSDKDLEGALIGLGSTYRTLGEYENSELTLKNAIDLFPNNRAVQVFYAITLYNLEEHHQAMELLLKCLIDTTSDDEILRYKRAIHFYSDKLDEIWI